MPSLRVNPGSSAQWEIALKSGTNTIGRDPECYVQIDHDSISSIHCQIVITGDSVILTDLGSTNGIFLDYSVVHETSLTAGQRLHVGEIEVEFIPDAPATPPAEGGVRIAITLSGFVPPVDVSAATSTMPSSVSPRPALRVTAHEEPARPPSTAASYLPDEYARSLEAPATCKYHPKSVARYRCPQCQLHFCELCVATRAGGERTGRYCRRCASECVAMNVQLVAPTDRHGDFFASIPEAFLFPFQGSGTYLLLSGGVVFALLGFLASVAISMTLFLKFMGVFVDVIVIGYTFAFLQKITRTAAMGLDEPLSWPELTDVRADIIGPFFQLLITILSSFGPALVLVLWVGWDTFTTGTADPYVMILSGIAFVCGLVYFPMALLAVTMLDSVVAINPLVVLPSMLRARLEYLVILAGFGVIVAVKTGAAIATHFIYVPVLFELVISLVSLYLFTVQMRLLGLLYYAKSAELSWVDP